MNDEYLRGYREGTHTATLVGMGARALGERRSALYWLAVSLIVLVPTVIFWNNYSWFPLLGWGLCAVVNARRAYVNHRLGMALANELMRWQADRPDAETAFQNNTFPTIRFGNNKGETE